MKFFKFGKRLFLNKHSSAHMQPLMNCFHNNKCMRRTLFFQKDINLIGNLHYICWTLYIALLWTYFCEQIFFFLFNLLIFQQLIISQYNTYTYAKNKLVCSHQSSFIIIIKPLFNKTIILL